MSTAPKFETAKARAEELNAWAAADCPGATYEDLLAISGDNSPAAACSEAATRISKLVALLADGRPIKESLDTEGFAGDRLPVYVAAFGGSKGTRIHDLLEAN